MKHAAVIEELNAALSGALVAMTGVVESLEGQLPGGEDAAHRSIAATGAFLGAVAAAEALPPVPDATAGVSFTRTLSLWRTGAEVHLASLRPFDAERSVRAATILEHGAAEFSRFAESFVLGGL